VVLGWDLFLADVVPEEIVIVFCNFQGAWSSGERERLGLFRSSDHLQSDVCGGTFCKENFCSTQFFRMGE
jgi:hypothetical protein